MKHRLFCCLAFALSAVILFSCPGVLFSISAQEVASEGLIADIRVGVSVSARAAILMEETSGTVLFEQNADARLPMASTTKIMTALVALENAALDLVITTPKEAVGTEGSSIYLFEGEALTLEELLWALLLASANDAAVAIAYGVSGGVKPFAALMNEKAEELGLENTHFVNPHGLDDPEHYTSAHDLAKIARAALANPLIREMTSTRKKTIPHNGTDGVRLLVNHNKLLRMYEGAIGVKTGFTKRSGRCLVSAAERAGLSLIAVTLDAPNDWNDHRSMLDAGFAAIDALGLAKEQELAQTVPVVGGVSDTVIVSNPAPVYLLLPSAHGELTGIIELPRFLYAGFPEGKTVGRAVWYLDGEIVAQTPLTVQTAVEKQKRPNLFVSFWNKLFHKS